MKKIIYLINCLLILLIPLIIITTPKKVIITKSIATTIKEKEIRSTVLLLNKNSIAYTEETTAVKTTESASTSLRKAEATTEAITTTTPEKEVVEPASSTPTATVLETVIASLCGYGLNCSGCSGNLASGKTLTDDIYYIDSTYGKVRVLAADREYAFGTIIRITNSNITSSFLAIVLDRGGVGKGKTYFADLLFKTEAEAENINPSKNVTFEILRKGF